MLQLSDSTQQKISSCLTKKKSKIQTLVVGGTCIIPNETLETVKLP